MSSFKYIPDKLAADHWQEHEKDVAYYCGYISFLVNNGMIEKCRNAGLPIELAGNKGSMFGHGPRDPNPMRFVLPVIYDDVAAILEIDEENDITVHHMQHPDRRVNLGNPPKIEWEDGEKEWMLEYVRDPSNDDV